MFRFFAFLKWPRAALIAAALPLAWRYRREIRDAVTQMRSRRRRTGLVAERSRGRRSRRAA